MLDLGEEIQRSGVRRRRGVGHDNELGRAGQRLDPDLAEEPPLGLLDVRVPRPDDHVDGRDGRGAECERGHRLRAADREHLLDAEEGATASAPECGSPDGPGGEQAAISGTPATCAGTMAITALDG